MSPYSNVVISGANRGIGLSFCKLIASMGSHVFAICRTASPELTQLAITHKDQFDIIEGCDLAKPASLLCIKKLINTETIDLLINNAGILKNETLGSLDFTSIEEQFEVNAMGPLRLTELLLPNLVRGAKIAMITSRMGSITDNTSGGRYGYRMSKVALNIASVSLAHDLKSRDIAVGIFHPGLVGTEMIGGQGDITPDQAAKRLLERIHQLSLANSGQFWHSNGEALPW